MSLLIAGSRSGSPHLRQRKTAMGTPQMRWREMHQSGRGATMLGVGSSPPAGAQVDAFDLVEGALAEGGAVHGRVHGDEPLLGSAGDDGVVAAPAVRVG